MSTSRFPRHVIFILIVLGSRISSSHFHLFFFVPSLCIVCRDVNRCALLVVRPSWKHFRAVCFPFETQSGSLLLLLAFCEFSFGADIITRGAHSALACGCCWRVAVSDVVFMFSVELNFRLLGVFLCGWQPADSQAGRPAEDSVVIPSVVVFTSEVLT